METVCVKFEKPSLKELEKAMARNHYVTKAEFIREAVREKLVDLEKREALRRLEQVYGAGAKKGRKITDEDIHRAGEEALMRLEKLSGSSKRVTTKEQIRKAKKEAFEELASK